VDTLPSGIEAIVNDNVTGYRFRVTLKRVNDIWVSPGGGEVLAEQAGVSSCDDL
jgi:hypothetical protein